LFCISRLLLSSLCVTPFFKKKDSPAPSPRAKPTLRSSVLLRGIRGHFRARIGDRHTLATGRIPKLHRPLAIFMCEAFRCFVQDAADRFSKTKSSLCHFLLKEHVHGSLSVSPQEYSAPSHQTVRKDTPTRLAFPWISPTTRSSGMRTAALTVRESSTTKYV
jgi:hypothetical protein